MDLFRKASFALKVCRGSLRCGWVVNLPHRVRGTEQEGKSIFIWWVKPTESQFHQRQFLSKRLPDENPSRFHHYGWMSAACVPTLFPTNHRNGGLSEYYVPTVIQTDKTLSRSL